MMMTMVIAVAVAVVVALVNLSFFWVRWNDDEHVVRM